jgi:hypothetical protein
MRFKSKIRKIIELTQERKNHIFEFHPDIKEYFSKISRVLKDPDQIRKSKHDPEVLLFYKYFANIRGGKYLAVVVKVNKRNFILTNYLTDKIITGEKIYEKE